MQFNSLEEEFEYYKVVDAGKEEFRKQVVDQGLFHTEREVWSDEMGEMITIFDVRLS